MIEFYIYLHCKPNGDPFYVGKGFGRRCRLFGNRGQHHKNVVAKYGGKAKIEILVFPRASEQQSFEDEQSWIRELRQAGYSLVNKTNGGDGIQGFRHSAETRAKQRVAATGRKHTPETIAKVSANNKAGTPEVRAKMRAAHNGKTLTPLHRARIGLSQKGRPGTPHTEETKAKLRLLRRQQVITAETRAKLSVAGKADWVRRKLNHSAMVHA